MTQLVHDPRCILPMQEHTGYEPCFSVALEPAEKKLHNKIRGPQGNLIADHRADYLALYGEEKDRTKPLGSPEIKDIRDNRDPVVMGREFLARNNGGLK